MTVSMVLARPVGAADAGHRSAAMTLDQYGGLFEDDVADWMDALLCN
jgi:hypothetical protein